MESVKNIIVIAIAIVIVLGFILFQVYHNYQSKKESKEKAQK